MEPRLQVDFADFCQRVQARLEEGYRVYGGRSRNMPTDKLLDEIQQELEDVAGWSTLLWSRLQGLRRKLLDHAQDEDGA